MTSHENKEFKNWLEYNFFLQLTIFKPREFYSIEMFAVQSMSRQSCCAMCKVLCIFVQGFLLTLSFPVYQNAHVNSIYENFYCIRCLFYFQCSTTVNIYKYKGKYVLRRIPHASDGWELLSLRQGVHGIGRLVVSLFRRRKTVQVMQ